MSQFRILKKRKIFRGRVFTLNSVDLRTPDRRRIRHEVIQHPGAAVMIPVLKTGELILVHQYRTAANRKLLEFPAGTLEHREPPLQCAKREIMEEIGYEAKKWTRLAVFYPAPGISSEIMHLFLAQDLRAKKAALDTDEFLEPVVFSYRRLERFIRSGRIRDAKTIIGFFYYSEYLKRDKGFFLLTDN